MWEVPGYLSRPKVFQFKTVKEGHYFFFGQREFVPYKYPIVSLSLKN